MGKCVGGGSQEMGSALKINLCTLPYRPPEIILGDRGFGNEIDSWSLGCVALEALQGEVLINSTVEVDALMQIFTTMGGPLPDGYLSKLPEFKSSYSYMGWPKKMWWPPPCLRDEVSLADTLGSLLQIEPPSRMTAAGLRPLQVSWVTNGFGPRTAASRRSGARSRSRRRLWSRPCWTSCKVIRIGTMSAQGWSQM